MDKSILALLLLIPIQLFSQNESGILKDTSIFNMEQTVDNSSNFSIGSYAQIDYNQPFGGETRNNGKLDVHRLVMTMAYRFNAKVRFFTRNRI